MNISQIMEKMIAFSNGNLHDMNHLMCVWPNASHWTVYPCRNNGKNDRILQREPA